MKVYHPMGSSMTLMVAPAALLPEADRPSDWMANGAPRRFDIRFEDGVCDVDDKLGKWLIENEYAHRSALKRVVSKLIH